MLITLQNLGWARALPFAYPTANLQVADSLGDFWQRIYQTWIAVGWAKGGSLCPSPSCRGVMGKAKRAHPTLVFCFSEIALILSHLVAVAP